MKTSHSCFPQTWVCKPRIPQPVYYRKAASNQSGIYFYAQSYEYEAGFYQPPHQDLHKINANQDVSKPCSFSSTQPITTEKESTFLKEQTPNPLLFCSTDPFYEILNLLR